MSKPSSTVGFKERDYTVEHSIYANLSGFGRTDALTRIGNQVFAVDLDLSKTSRPQTPPCASRKSGTPPGSTGSSTTPPSLTPSYVNIGEALGVRAMLNPVDIGQLRRRRRTGPNGDPPRRTRALSRSDVAQMAGGIPGKPLDEAKVKKGAALYQQRCQGCHLPPVSELIADREKEEPRSGGALPPAWRS